MALFDFFKRDVQPIPQQPEVKPIPQKRAFHAAKVDRLTASWFTTANSINTELRSDLNKLRMRSRDLVKNNDYAKKFINLCVTNIVGPNGFNLQARVENAPGQPDQLANTAIELAFYNWAKRGSCDITGKMGFADLQRAVIRGAASDGEYLVRIVRGKAAGNAYHFALQVLDIDRLNTNLNQNATNSSNAIVMGIELDTYRRPIFYHVLTSHPNGATGTHRTSERIPAADILHDFIPENPEQVRGVPWMSASMLSLHHMGEFEQSALLAARKGADTLGFFVSPDGSPPMVEDMSGGESITVSVPGSYDTLPEGYDFRAYDSRYPDAMIGEFSKSYLRRIASGLNVAYNGLANDLEGVNFSSIRSGVIDERDQWMTQQGWFIEAFMVPVYNEWLRLSLLAGAITMPNGSPLPASKLDKFLEHQWQGRRWQWVDPMKDIEAARLAVKSGIASPQMIAAQNGVDVEDVIASIVQFEKQVAAAGVSMIDYTDGAAHQVNAQAANTDANNTQSDKAMLAIIEQMKNLKQGDTHVHFSDGMVQLEATIHTMKDEAP